MQSYAVSWTLHTARLTVTTATLATATLTTVPQICLEHKLPLEATRRLLRRNPDVAKRARVFGTQRVFDDEAVKLIIALVRAHQRRYSTWHPEFAEASA
jgi:hypothetical protein